MKYSLILLLLIFSQNIFSQENQEDIVIEYSEIQVKPEYPGGMKSFYGFIAKNFRAPEEENLNGEIIIKYIVEKDGTMTNMVIVKDVGFKTGEEAIRVLRLMPKWRQGEHEGKYARTSHSVKINVGAAKK